MNKNQDVLKPVGVSPINPVYDMNGCIAEWELTVTFDKHNVKPPHAKGARVSAKNLDNKTLAKYEFSESVMRKGLENAWLFRDAISKQIARLNNENSK